MKKIIFIFCLFIVSLAYSQNEKEMLDVGIKKGTVKKIFKSFDGDINIAIDRWAVTGSGKLSKKFIKSAEKLGIDKIYLSKKLKEARKVRMQAIAAGVAGAAAGYAASQPKTTPVKKSNSNKSSYSNPGGYSSEGAYSNPGGYSSEGAYSNPGGISTADSSPTYISAPADIYQKNEYGLQEKTGEIKNNYSGGVDIYQKNEYGLQEKTGEMKNNYSGGIDINTKNEYGLQEKTGELKTNYSGGTDIYQKNEYGLQEKVGEYRKNSSGGYDVYKKNQYGLMEKTGTVKKIP